MENTDTIRCNECRHLITREDAHEVPQFYGDRRPLLVCDHCWVEVSIRESLEHAMRPYRDNH